MTAWRDDDQLFSIMREELYTPVVGDILDQHGRHHQFLPPEVRPLLPDMRVAGRAMPVLQAEVFGPQAKPFGEMCAALDALRPNEIYIATGGGMRSANWGEIMTAAGRSRGAVGAVIDGWHRDTLRVLEQGWPVFSRGSWAQDSAPRMSVIDYRCRIEIGATVVEPGDVVFGDRDGVVVIPAVLVDAVIPQALAKARGEKMVRRAIEQGMSTTQAFATFGIL